MAAEFIRIWLTWTGMVLGAAVVAAIWAARAGHFRDQERARHLALWAEVEEEKVSGERYQASGESS